MYLVVVFNYWLQNLMLFGWGSFNTIIQYLFPVKLFTYLLYNDDTFLFSFFHSS
ncbi:hypothetical protein AtEden1_Chr2g0257241 [Arabidopsis thaliana]